ncbi:MAG: hypothetical protein K1000chlam2_00124 [Chlamydiae bacterium]|nr:hypothetical protein [Chlamydiota bacterium]
MTIKEPFSICNPYRAFSFAKEKVPSHARKNSDQILILADRVADWGKNALFKDYEQQVDFAGFTAKILDWGMTGTLVALQVTVAVYNFLQLHFLDQTVFSYIPHGLRILGRPISAFLYFLGIIEGVVEFLNLKRTSVFLYRMELKCETPLEKLRWIKNEHFSLNDEEVSKIHRFVENKLPNLNVDQKADRFDQIAKKALQLKYESLKRRITPGLGEEVARELSGIMQGLTSPEASVRLNAEKRANLLIESVTNQAKNKIFVHILGLVAISFTLISMVGVLGGMTSGGFFIALGVAALVFGILQFVAKRGTLAKEVGHYYDRLAEFNLSKVVSTIELPWTQKAL